MNLNSIMIGSEDPKALKDYYAKLFGSPTWEDGDYIGWQIGNGSITVAHHDQIKGKNTSPGRILLNIETEDVKGEFEKFKKVGATVVQEPYKPEPSMEMWVCTFSDPDNNYFQLMSPMPEM
ncbi:MAG: VOC family protein [Actinomycetota bacterium]